MSVLFLTRQVHWPLRQSGAAEGRPLFLTPQLLYLLADPGWGDSGAEGRPLFLTPQLPWPARSGGVEGVSPS